MSEINKIQSGVPPQVSNKIKPEAKGEKKAQFEEQLLKTVADLQNLDSQLDQVLQSQEKGLAHPSQGVSQASQFIQSIEGVVESLAGEKSPKAKNAYQGQYGTKPLAKDHIDKEV